MHSSQYFVQESLDQQDIEQEIIQRERDRQLLNSVLSLPLKFREVIILYYYEGLNIQEITDVLNISANGVKSRLHRARKQIEKQLEKAGIDL